MSGTKRVITPYPVVNSQSMASNIQGASTNVMGMDYGLYIAEWIGTAPVGKLQFEILKERRNNIEVWELVDFGGATGTDIAVSGDTGSHQVLFEKMPFEWIRCKYVRTSGTGTLDVFLTVKEG